MDKPVVFYRVRRLTDGLYSTGGSFPTFKKTGKSWLLSQLKSHLRMIQKNRRSFEVYKGCELVSFTELIKPANIALNDLINPLEQELVVKKLAGKI